MPPVVSLQPTHASSSRALDLLFDSVTFGMEAEFSVFHHADLARFAGALKAAGVLGGRRVPANPHGTQRFTLSVPIMASDERPLGNASADLMLTPLADGRMKLTGASCIRVNPLQLLRRWRGGEACGGSGLDGNTNVIGPFEDLTDDAFREQMNLARIAIDAVVDVINGALPDRANTTSQSMHLRAVEVCRDVGRNDAVALVRRLQRTMLAGSVTRMADAYRKGASDEAGVPAVRWKLRNSAPTFKVYAKRLDLVRAEVACLKREMVRAVMAGKGVAPKAEVAGADAVTLLEDFAAAARPLLDEVVRHAEEAAVPMADTAELLIGLRPLIDMAAGNRQGPGTPPKPESIGAARAALATLIETGTFHASGTRARHALRRVLQGLSGPTGPLHRGGSRGTVFTIRAGHAAAVVRLAHLGGH